MVPHKDTAGIAAMGIPADLLAAEHIVAGS